MAYSRLSAKAQSVHIMPGIFPISLDDRRENEPIYKIIDSEKENYHCICYEILNIILKFIYVLAYLVKYVTLSR